MKLDDVDPRILLLTVVFGTTSVNQALTILFPELRGDAFTQTEANLYRSEQRTEVFKLEAELRADIEKLRRDFQETRKLSDQRTQYLLEKIDRYRRELHASE